MHPGLAMDQVDKAMHERVRYYILCLERGPVDEVEED